MKKSFSRGVTLVEMMLAVVIFAFMSAGLTAALLAGRSAWQVNENSSIVQQQARNVIWVVARDLRQSDGLTITSDAHSLTFSFTHPTDGAVNYAWNDTTRQLVRTDSVKRRIVGNNISAFSLTHLGYGVELSLTAMRVSSNIKAGTLSLKQKVVFR
jgi:prepilin-type N-terminal cleavage/methylation domain-containing protein